MLAIWGGADQGSAEAVRRSIAALDAAGVEHRTVVYPDAPHSFFDRTREYAEASADAWREMLASWASRLGRRENARRGDRTRRLTGVRRRLAVCSGSPGGVGFIGPQVEVQHADHVGDPQASVVHSGVLV